MLFRSATAGRTTLAGEGLQHQDGHSQLLASNIPNCISYDPTDGKTDHSREYVPFVAYKNNGKAKYIGDVESFANIASTVSEFFNLENIFPGKSFLNQI